MGIRQTKIKLRDSHATEPSAMEFVTNVRECFTRFERERNAAQLRNPNPDWAVIEKGSHELNLKRYLLDLHVKIADAKELLRKEKQLKLALTRNPEFTFEEQLLLLDRIRGKSNSRTMYNCFESCYRDTGFFSLWY